MLEDITEITRYVLDKFEPENIALANPKICHNIYRKLTLLIQKADFIAEHHLNVDLSYEFSKNNSFSVVASDWRHFLNSDLENLNTLIKEYFQELMLLSLDTPMDTNNSLIKEKYNIMYFHLFIKERYSIGYIDPCGFTLTSLTLNPKIHDKQCFHIENSDMLNLANYGHRAELQKNLREERALLELELQRLKKYILKNYTLESLL